MERRFHPVAELFPLMQGQEFSALVDSIRTKGLLNPIWLHPDGTILDGRNRYLACLEAGVEPRYQTWDEKGSLAGFVVAQNIDRRHLSGTQKALLAMKLMPVLAAEAKDRQREHGKTAPGKRSLRQTVDEVSRNKNQDRATEQAAKMAGTNRQYVADLQKIKKEAPEVYAKIDAGELEIPEAKQEMKQQKKRALAAKIKLEPSPPPTGPYRVIAIDPPWQYSARADDLTHRARNPYPDMTLDEIKALPVADLAHSDCILWLWTTNAFIWEARECLDAWGFEKKTILTWVKDRMGTGDWLRGRTEHCILATRGKPIVTLTNQTTVINGPLREHSRKPDEFYTLVESLCPGNRLEMFQLAPRENWQGWGARHESRSPTVN